MDGAVAATEVEGGGDYTLLAILGSGAVAHVCVARRADGRQVALKVLRTRASHDPDLVERFRDEAHILRSLQHPGIVRAERLLDYDGRLVLELEYVHGASLERVLVDHRFPPRAALQVVRQIADSLHAAYHGGFGPDGAPMRVVHRDLKPANAVLEPGGQVKLLDFGVAKAEFAEREAMSVTNVWGSVGYDAPERRAARSVTPAADVYALGVTLFVLLTAKPLIASKKPEHHDADVASSCAKAADRGVPEAALELVRAMVAHDPAARLSMAEVASRVDDLGEEVPGDDLTTFAAAVIPEVLGQIAVQAPAESSHYGSLRFLERARPQGPERPLTSDEAADAIRDLLRAEDWESRRVEVRRLLARAEAGAGGRPPEAPLLELLERARAPWWQFWAQPPRATELEAALLLLADGGGPDLLGHARALVAHADERVVRAARFVLERAEA